MKIKIERDYNSEHLFIGARGYVVGWFYMWVDGSYNNHAYHLDSIAKGPKKEWILNFPEGISLPADSAPTILERVDIRIFRRCSCSETCKGYVIKDVTKDV